MYALLDATGGNCHTLMIANIWGEAAQMEETVGVLIMYCIGWDIV